MEFKVDYKGPIQQSGFHAEFLVKGRGGYVRENFARPCPFSGVSFYMYLYLVCL